MLYDSVKTTNNILFFKDASGIHFKANTTNVQVKVLFIFFFQPPLKSKMRIFDVML